MPETIEQPRAQVMNPATMIGNISPAGGNLMIPQMGGMAFSTAQLLLANGFNLDCLRTNTTLRDDEWEALDAAAMAAFYQPLVAVDDLLSRGLTRDLGGMGVLISQYNRMSETERAQVNMWAGVDANQSRMLFDIQEVPIPCIFQEFQLDARFIETARRGGTMIDTDQAEAASRVVGEELERMLFDGNTTAMGGKPIYGYRTHPSRNTSSGSTWGTATNIIPNINAMAAGIRGDNVPGPYILYLHHDQFQETLAYVDTTQVRTVREAAIAAIPELADIKYASFMTAGEAVMVAMNSMTADVAIAESFAPYEWEGRGGFSIHFRGMMVGAPRVKADYHGRSGIYHMTGI